MEEAKKAHGTENKTDFVPVGQTEPTKRFRQSDAVVEQVTAGVDALDVLPPVESLPPPSDADKAHQTVNVGTSTGLPNGPGVSTARNK